MAATPSLNSFVIGRKRTVSVVVDITSLPHAEPGTPAEHGGETEA
jgi:hypothetical protein